jgi:hypothetical protein
MIALSRRAMLRATAATAALAVPAALAASVVEQIPDPLIALGERWAVDAMRPPRPGGTRSGARCRRTLEWGCR